RPRAWQAVSGPAAVAAVEATAAAGSRAPGSVPAAVLAGPVVLGLVRARPPGPGRWAVPQRQGPARQRRLPVRPAVVAWGRLPWGPEPVPVRAAKAERTTNTNVPPTWSKPTPTTSSAPTNAPHHPSSAPEPHHKPNRGGVTTTDTPPRLGSPLPSPSILGDTNNRNTRKVNLDESLARRQDDRADLRRRCTAHRMLVFQLQPGHRPVLTRDRLRTLGIRRLRR